MITLAKKILSNTAWQVIGKVITALLGIFSIKYITNYLSTTEYGEYTAIYDFVAIFAILADFGLFTIAVREMAHDEKNKERILGNVLSARTLIGILSLGFASLIALAIPKYQGTHIPFGISVVSIATLLMLISGTVASALQVYLKMQWFSIASLVGKIVSIAYIILTIVVWFPGDPQAGFPHLLYGWIYGNILTLLLTYIPARKLIRIRFKFEFSFWKEVIGKTLPYGFALLLGMIYFRTGSVLMSFFGMRHEVGIYGVPMKIFEIADLIPVFFMNSILPVLTQSIKENMDRVRRIIQYAFEFMALAAFPMLFGGWVLAKPLIAGISNSTFLSTATAVGSDYILMIVLVAMTFFYFHTVFGFSLIALGMQKKLLIVNFCAAVFNITANIILIPRFSLLAVPFVAVFTELIILAGNFSMVYSRMHFRPQFKLIGKALFASVIMAGIIFFIDPLLRNIFELKSLLITIPVGGIVYLGNLFLLRAFTPEMLALLRRGREKEGITEPPPIN